MSYQIEISEYQRALIHKALEAYKSTADYATFAGQRGDEDGNSGFNTMVEEFDVLIDLFGSLPVEDDRCPAGTLHGFCL